MFVGTGAGVGEGLGTGVGVGAVLVGDGSGAGTVAAASVVGDGVDDVGVQAIAAATSIGATSASINLRLNPKAVCALLSAFNLTPFRSQYSKSGPDRAISVSPLN